MRPNCLSSRLLPCGNEIAFLIVCVFQSFCRGGGGGGLHVTIAHDTLDLITGTDPPPAPGSDIWYPRPELVQTCSPENISTNADICSRYSQAVRILLEHFLVFFHVNHSV